MAKFFANKYLNIMNLVGGCLFLVSCSVSNALPNNFKLTDVCPKAEAPQSIAGMDINLQIENTVSNLTNGFPTQGVAVMHYKKDGTWTAQGTGGENQQAYYGTYKYKRTSVNTAVEKAVDTSLQNAPYTTTYTFETPRSGKWVQDFANGMIIFSGSFTMVPSDLPIEQHLAPTTNAGLNVALIIKSATSETLPASVYATKGLVLQTYSLDGTLVFLGFGPRMLNSHGTYTFKKVSANTAVEETIQTSNLFTLPYTMVYTFQTPTSGTWFQNLGNGLLKFTGTFDTFPQ